MSAAKHVHKKYTSYVKPETEIHFQKAVNTYRQLQELKLKFLESTSLYALLNLNTFLIIYVKSIYYNDLKR